MIIIATYKIIHDIAGCIGCGACAAISDNWKMVDIKGEEKAKEVKTEFGDSELENNKEAAESCPVEVIKIIDKATGKKIV